MSTLREVTEAALHLPLNERAELLDTLSRSIDLEDVLDPTILCEAAQRVNDLATGIVQGISWDESRRRIHGKFPWLT